MDDRRFDALARALGGASTRRSALGALAALLAGGAALGADAKKKSRKGDGPQAAGKRRNKRRCKPECTGNFSCVKGACVCEQVLCGAACCDTGQVCQRGRCVGQGTVFCHDLGEACGDGTPCCDGLQCGSGQGGGPVACWPAPGEQCDSDAECPYGHSCVDNACVVDPPPPTEPECTPATCAGAGASCGEIPDGCDGTLDCGTCPGAQTCGGGGTPNACGCPAVPCAGGTVDQTSCACTCPAGQTACSGTCADLQTDGSNCGACGTACTGTRTCLNGVCTLPATGRHVASFGTSGDGSASDQMNEPAGIFVNAAGDTAWITDRQNKRVVVWAKSGSTWSQSAAFGSATDSNTGATANDGTFDQPTGIVANAAGDTVWVGDAFNNRIAVWTKSGATWNHTATLGTSGTATGASQTDGGFNVPWDVAIDATGTTLAVIDSTNNRVVLWTRSGSSWSHTASFGVQGSTGLGESDGKLNRPGSIAMDPGGTTVWAADSRNHRVVVWSKGAGGWAHVASFGAQGTTGLGQTDGKLNSPNGVTVDPTGTTAWVADMANDRIAVWTKNPATSDWVHTSSFGTSGSTGLGQTDGKLYLPFRLAVDPTGPTAWVADTFNDRIAIWTP